MSVVSTSGETLIFCAAGAQGVRCTYLMSDADKNQRKVKNMETSNVLEDGRVPSRKESSWEIEKEESKSQGRTIDD